MNKQANLPYVFVHDKIEKHVLYAISHLQKQVPDAIIYLISDSHPKSLSKVKWIETDVLCPGLEEFRKLYEHLSTNSENFERKCFERWFQVAALLERENIQRAVTAECDVLIYFDIGSELAKLEDIDLTIIHEYTFHLMGILRPGALRQFCDFILHLYRDEERLVWLRNFAKWHQESNGLGGVCDMTAMCLFNQEKHCRIKELDGIFCNKWIDRAMRQNQGFLMDKGHKGVSLINGERYLTTMTGERIKPGILHFQGDSKQRMLECCSPPGLGVRTEARMIDLKHYLHRQARPWILRYRRLSRLLGLAHESSAANGPNG
jgi:hypothetical protein